MRIVSWNVNGLRAVHRNGLWKHFLALRGDIYCLQETKAEPDQLTPETREIQGFHSFWSSSKVKKGYSGVALYTREEPKKVEYGMGIQKFDQEGRLIVAYFKDFVLCNVYFPNGGQGPERLAYKFEFYDAFLEFIDRLRKERHHVIFCGDVNTAHEEIDLARPKENEDNTGFLPEERAWIDTVISHGFTDTFRHFYPDRKNAYTYWDMKTAARERNVGWRIDYFFVDSGFLHNIKGVSIHPHIYGSDHCPIDITLK